MMRTVLGAVLLLALSTGAGPATAAPAAGTPRITPYGTALPAPFVLPEAARSPALRVTVAGRAPAGHRYHRGNLFVDGVDTGVAWRLRVPEVYRIGKHHFLLYDRYNTYRAYLWQARAKRLTALGEISLLPVARWGRALLGCTKPRSSQLRLCHLDLRRRRLQPLWTAAPGSYPRLLGRWRGGLVLADPGARGLQRKTLPAGQITVHHLVPGRRPTQRVLQLGPYRLARGTDGIRGDRLLLVGPSTLPTRHRLGPLHRPFSAPVAVYDLRRRRIRRIGRAHGDWSRCTGGIHAMLALRWQPRQMPHPDHCGWGITYVHPKTERLSTARGSILRILRRPRAPRTP